MRDDKQVKLERVALQFAEWGTGEQVSSSRLRSNKFIWNWLCDGIRGPYLVLCDATYYGVAKSPAPRHGFDTRWSICDVVDDLS